MVTTESNKEPGLEDPQEVFYFDSEMVKTRNSQPPVQAQVSSSPASHVPTANLSQPGIRSPRTLPSSPPWSMEHWTTLADPCVLCVGPVSPGRGCTNPWYRSPQWSSWATFCLVHLQGPICLKWPYQGQIRPDNTAPQIIWVLKRLHHDEMMVVGGEKLK